MFWPFNHQVARSRSGRPTSHNDCRQLVHSHVPLSLKQSNLVMTKGQLSGLEGNISRAQNNGNKLQDT